MPHRQFEWDRAKAAKNAAQHGVSFRFATEAFRDPFAIELIDDRYDYGEERIVLIGMAHGLLVTVVYTEREDRTKLISARRATRIEQDEYYRQET